MIRDTLHRARLYFVLRYGISGVVGGIVQVVTDYLFVEVLRMWYMWGVISGFILALVTVFALHKYWTFREPSIKRLPVQFLLYTTISLLSLAGNIYCMYLFTSIMGMWYILSQVITILIVSGASFILNTFITFKRSQFGNEP